MSKIVHISPIKNEAHCLSNCLDSVMPYVDESFLLIDDRTTDSSEDIALSYGCKTLRWKFENFAKFGNKLLSENIGSWVFIMNGDEVILPEVGRSLRLLVEKAESQGIDAIYFARKHWYDLEMTNEKREWYPDFQCKFFKNNYPQVHYINYVHECVTGFRKPVQLKEMETHHFNCYWKENALKLGLNYNWKEMEDLYNGLKLRQQQEKGIDIWP